MSWAADPGALGNQRRSPGARPAPAASCRATARLSGSHVRYFQPWIQIAHSESPLRLAGGEFRGMFMVMVMHSLPQVPGAEPRLQMPPRPAIPTCRGLREGSLIALRVLGTGHCLIRAASCSASLVPRLHLCSAGCCGFTPQAPTTDPGLQAAGRGLMLGPLQPVSRKHLGLSCFSPTSQAAGLGHVSCPEPPMWRF